MCKMNEPVNQSTKLLISGLLSLQQSLGLCFDEIISIPSSIKFNILTFYFGTNITPTIIEVVGSKVVKFNV